MYGWTGQRLKVYLTEGKIIKEETPEWLRRDYLGGRGLNARTLFDEVKPGIDPLSPANVFIVGTGPIVGTLAPGACRWTATAKSPLTSVFGDGCGGGDFSAELKFAGFDQVIFYGKSPKPVYLWINDDRVELRDASHLWGKDIWETHHLLVKELGEHELREISIGPAGENKVRFASIQANLSRTAGRSGMGTVMGSKNLKAMAVRGTGSIKIAKPREFFEVAKYAVDKIITTPLSRVYMEEGSLYLVRLLSTLGMSPTRNYQTTWIEAVDKLSTEAFEREYAVRHRGCFACPTQCSHYYEVKQGPFASHGEGVDYASQGNMGARCGNDNLASILYANTLCDQLGVDSISCGGAISFAMEAWQRGLISANDTDGLDLSWGNADSIIQLIRKIAYREGFGNLLAEGTQLASQKINGSSAFVMTIKGLEGIALDPRASKGDALALATSTRGADHLRGLTAFILPHGPPTEDGCERAFGDILGRERARSLANPRGYQGWGGLMFLCQNNYAALNSLEICNRMTGPHGLDMEDLAKLFSTATGMDMDGRELQKVGERVFNVEKAFNIREGLRRKDDTLPHRWFFEEVPDGPAAGERIDPHKFQEMLDELYEFRGWDREGFPTEKKLEELNLGDIAEQLRDLRETV